MTRADVTTVEQLVRQRLSDALGGGRGIVEGAVPTIVFTVCWIASKDLRFSLTVSIAAAVVLLIVRLVQRSTVQFVLTALFGIGIAAIFASRTGEARDVFLPGILLNSASSVFLVISILVGWPVVGFIIGSITGEVTEWHDDKQLVKLCSTLTWLFAAPCILRVVVLFPLWLGDHVALLGPAKIALGWPLLVAALLAMTWVLSRNATPLDPPLGGSGTPEPPRESL